MPAGYSGTPLSKKLGFKDGFVVSIYNAPENYFQLLHPLPAIEVSASNKKMKDLIHYFVSEKKLLLRDLYNLKNSIKQDGAIWISWPKKSSDVTTDLTEDVIRNLAIQNGLVDIKVCAVDETWSALKLVIPVKSRTAIPKSI